MSGETRKAGERTKARTTGWSEEALKALACPVCRGALSTSAGMLICGVCARRYAFVDGIPILTEAASEG